MRRGAGAAVMDVNRALTGAHRILNTAVKLMGDFRGTDRFIVQRRLGAGGFGVVYEARDTMSETAVALKTLRSVTPESLYRFKREFRSLADITHRNLVQLYELLCDTDEWFFTMELVRGTNFLEHIWGVPGQDPDTVPAHHDSTQSELTEPSLMTVEIKNVLPEERSLFHSPANVERLLDATKQLVEAVAVLHRSGNIHRDLKPSNVLVDHKGRVVVLDFGLVVDIGSEATLQSLQIAGTPAYMSPEQSAGLPLSAASDWYSVGVMLYQSLTGELPFSGNIAQVLMAKQSTEPTPPGRVVAGVPDHLDALCRDLLRREEARRPGVDEIFERLQTPGWKAARSPLVRQRFSPPSSIFVGREKLQAAMRTAFEETSTGERVTLCVEGPSGIGKSALVRHFLDTVRVDQPTAVVLTGRCYERESVPYKGVDSFIDVMARYLRRLSAADVEALLPRDTAALSNLFPVLRHLEEHSGIRRKIAAVPDSQELRRRAFAALREMIGRLADKWPTVVFVDDLQWGDVDSADLLNEVLRGADAPPLLFIAAYRSEETASSPFLRVFVTAESERALNMRHLRVDRLSAEESKRLAESLLEANAPRFVQVAAAIANEAGGSPFFIDELVRSTELTGRDPFAVTERPADTDARETTLAELIRLRLARLSREVRDLLELVAVNGRPIPIRLLKKIALHEGFESALALLRSEHLVRTRETDSDDELECYHDRIRETITRFLDPETAKSAHLRLANAFEQWHEIDAETLAEHLLAAGETRRALQYVPEAAENAERVLAFDRAARLYRRALELGKDGVGNATAIQRRLGDALRNAGRGSEAAAAYLNVQSDSIDETVEMKRRAAEQLLFSGHFDEGLAVIHDVLAAVGMRLPQTRLATLLAFFAGRIRVRLRGLRYRERDERSVPRAELTRVDACWSVSLGLGLVDTMRGAVFQTLNLLLALETGELHRITRGVALETAYVSIGGSRTRRRTGLLLQHAESLANRADTPYAHAFYKLTAGIAAYLNGQWRTGAELTTAAEQLFIDQCTGVTWETDSARFFSIWCSYFLGDLPLLAKRYPVLLNDAQERGDLYAATMMRSWVAHYAELAADNPTAARNQVRAALQDWSQAGFHIQHMWELWSMTDIALYEQRGTIAWERVTQTWPALNSSLLLRVQFTHITMLDVRARAAIAAARETTDRQERDLLLRAATRSARTIERQHTAWGNAMALMIRGCIHLTRKQFDRALQTFAEAQQALGPLDMPLHATVAQWRRGELLGGNEGTELISSAREWMHERGISNPDRMMWMLAPASI
jgi:eukaryotic-like serine/threonine-protein kinase